MKRSNHLSVILHLNLHLQLYNLEGYLIYLKGDLIVKVFLQHEGYFDTLVIIVTAKSKHFIKTNL